MALTTEGLQIRRYEEVLADLTKALQDNIDPNINTSDDTFLGQLIKEFSLAVAEIEDLIEAVNDNFNIDKAEGTYLDYLAVFRNMSRIQPAYSATQYQLFTGNDGVVVSKGALVESVVSGDKFQTIADFTISTSACYKAVYSVKTLVPSTQYTLTIGSTTYSYTTSASPTNSEVLNGLQAQINADINKTFTSVVSDNDITITNNNLDNTLSISSTTYLGVDSVGVFSSISAVEYGPIIAPANTITKIVSAIGGLFATNNYKDLVVGRLQETDTDFRTRIKTTEQLANVGTTVAITSRVSNIQGVTSVLVEENVTGTTDASGRPPSAIEVIVQGGSDSDVATEIFNTKAAGIPTFGNTTTIITDSLGINRDVNFTRPVVKNIAVQVTYTQYVEETLPSDAATAIKNIVKNEINSLGLGVDVIPGRLFGPIYSEVSGIDSIIVEIQELVTSGDAPDPGNWQTTRLPIASTEYANTEFADIYIVEQ